MDQVTSRPLAGARPRAASPVLRRLAGLLLVAGALALAAGWIARRIERRGVELAARGRRVVAALGGLAGDVRRRDLEGIAGRYAADYSGLSLGLTRLGAAAERDGVAVARFLPGGPAAGRDAALREWRHYLAGFAAIDEVQMHLDRFSRWDDETALAATVRFELIGTRRGDTRPSHDRALWRLRFAPAPGGGLAVRAAELVEGERVRGERPHFTEVAAAAGVDFRNRFYPQFLTTPLRFAMIRYGPAGMTAADYDGDGLYDLFVPDGVAARLFRNRGDGTFEDRTARAGLAGLDGVSVGLFADYDNDGVKDLFVSRTFRPNQLFRGRGDGTFRDATARSGLGADCCTTVASWADVDLDGDLDLYVGRYLDPRRASPTALYARNGEPNRLYRNDGDGTFTDVTVRAGVGEPGLCLGTVFGDYDDDGDADLYVVNDFGRNTLYENRGDGTFADVTVATGTLAYGAGMSASFGDYDNDGRLDLYVANIRSDQRWFAEAPSVRRYFLGVLRHGDWRGALPLFFEIRRQSGSDFVAFFRQMASGNTLLRNRGRDAGGRVAFEDVTWAARANPPGWFWGSGFYDFDNDGWQDVYSTNGWVYGQRGTDLELDFFDGVIGDPAGYERGDYFDPARFGSRSWHGWERNRYLRNERDGTFTEIATANGSDLLRNSRGIAVADFWNRGALDIAVAASTDRHALLRNEIGPRRHWLALDLAGGAGRLRDGTNRDAVGARVTVRAAGLSQVREVVLGDGYGAQNALRLHFGLDRAARVDELVVRWPRSGRRQRFRGVAANAIYRLEEGSPRLERLAPGRRGAA